MINNFIHIFCRLVYLLDLIFKKLDPLFLVLTSYVDSRSTPERRSMNHAYSLAGQSDRFHLTLTVSYNLLLNLTYC